MAIWDLIVKASECFKGMQELPIKFLMGIKAPTKARNTPSVLEEHLDFKWQHKAKRDEKNGHHSIPKKMINGLTSPKRNIKEIKEWKSFSSMMDS